MSMGTRRTRATRRAALVCAALAGVTVALGVTAPPSGARPFTGIAESQGTAAAPGERSGGADSDDDEEYVVRPTTLAGVMGVHVEGGWLLQ